FTDAPSLSVTIGSETKQAVYAIGSGTNVLTFSYTVQSGDMDMDGIALGALAVNGGSINNNAGDAAQLILNNVGVLSGVMVNTVRPSVVLSTTSSSYDNIKTITATFSEPVTGFTIADIDMSVVGTASAAAHSLTTADNITYTFIVTMSGVGAT